SRSEREIASVGCLSTILPGAVNHGAEAIHGLKRRLDAWLQRFPKLPFEILAYRIVPDLENFVPMDVENFHRFVELCAAGAQGHVISLPDSGPRPVWRLAPE